MLTHSVWAKALSATVAAAVALAPVSAFAQTNEVRNTTHIPLTGTTADGTPFAASMVLQRFERVGGQLLAVGVLESGELNGTSLVGQAVALPVQVKKEGGNDGQEGGFGALQQGATAVPALLQSTHGQPARLLEVVPAQANTNCTVLHLTLGPLDLNLLGLLVHLDRVVLTIDAQPGGGLLGDLLCGVANLLSGLNLLATLNRILTILNGLGL